MKKVISLLICLCLALSVLPMTVFAAEADEASAVHSLLSQEICAAVDQIQSDETVEIPSGLFENKGARDVGDNHYVEKEPNNERDGTANAVENDYTVSGVLNYNFDIDCYAFFLTQKSKVTVIVAAEYSSFMMGLYDSNEIIGSSVVGTYDSGFYMYALSQTIDKGVYYLSMLDSKLNTNVYTFYIIIEPIGSSHTHSYTSVVTFPTCTAKGYTTYICSCGDSYQADQVEALGHVEIIDKAVAATCTNTGLKEGKHCSVCSQILVKQEVVPALGHSYENGRCTRCGAKDPAYSITGGQIQVGSATVAVGGTVEVPIALKNNPGITAMRLKVAYGEGLTLTNISYNTAVGGTFQQPQTMTSPVILNWVNGLEDVEGDWTYAVLTFAAAEGIGVSTDVDITVTYDTEDVFNLDDIDVAFSVENGKVTIVPYLPGDVNGDGKVNNKDATRLLQYLSGWDVKITEVAMDVNGDGKVNNKDATRLLQYLSGWDVKIY